MKNLNTTQALRPASKDSTWLGTLWNNIIKYKYCYLMVLPVFVWYIVFSYAPMYGITIAFKHYSPSLGVFGSPWAGMGGFKHFVDFFNNPQFGRIIKNTLAINVLSLLFGFTLPIIFALLLNEIRSSKFKRTIQTITYFPHFVSLVVVCGMIKGFLMTDGVVNDVIVMLGGERSNFMTKPEAFRTIYIISDLWQGLGWNSIIYLAALSGIDTQLYEACVVDGGGKFRRIWHITLPGIRNTIIMMLILRVGSMMTVGSEKILLLYNPLTYETADVISTYVHRRGLVESQYSFSTAVSLFNAIINLVLLTTTNILSRKYAEASLW